MTRINPKTPKTPKTPLSSRINANTKPASLLGSSSALLCYCDKGSVSHQQTSRQNMSHKNDNDEEDEEDSDDHTSLSSLTDPRVPLRGDRGQSKRQQDEETDEHVTTAVAQHDACWDGCWFADGLHGMFLESLTRTDHNNPSRHDDDDDDDWVCLDMDPSDQEGWERLFVEVLEPRDLQIAAGIMRRVSEGTYHSHINDKGTPSGNRHRTRFPIRSLSATVWKEWQANQTVGDCALAAKKYKKALKKYKAALKLVPRDDHFFVAPTEQIEAVADVLANQAACYNAVEKFQTAGRTATAALLFVGDHAGARFQRARAGMALGKNHPDATPYLIQAMVDWQELLTNNSEDEADTDEESAQAEEQLRQVQQLLRDKQEEFERKQVNSSSSSNNNTGWQDMVDSVRSKCW